MAGACFVECATPLCYALGGGFGEHVGVGEFFFFAFNIGSRFGEFFLEAGAFFIGIHKALQRHVNLADGGVGEGGAGWGVFYDFYFCGIEECNECDVVLEEVVGGVAVAVGWRGFLKRGAGLQEEANFLVAGDLVFAAQGACGIHGVVDVGCQCSKIGAEFCGQRGTVFAGGPLRGLDGAFAIAEGEPDFFCDEGAVGMQEAQDAREAVVEGGEGAAVSGRGGVGEVGFGAFEVAGAEVVPDEGVEQLGGGGELVVVEGGVDLIYKGVELAEHEVREGGEAVRGGVSGWVAGAVMGAEAGGVPEFVAEVAAFFDLFFIEADVLALGGDAHEAEAQAVRAVFDDEVEGIGGVAERFGEFAALGVADEAGEVNVTEGDVAGDVVGARGLEFESSNDHACDPEEDDVGAGDEGGGRVEFCARRLVHGGVGPEPGGGPGVKAVGVLLPIRAWGVELAAGFAVAIPDGDAVAPDDLARETPVLDVFEPVGVNLFPAGGVEADEAVLHDAQGGGDHFAAKHFFVVEEPLFGEAWLDGHLAALREADGVFVGFFFNEEALGREKFGSFFAGIEAVEAMEFWAVGAVDFAVRIEHINNGEVMAEADVEVGAVVCGCDFEDAGAEFKVNVFVGDDGDFCPREGTPDVFADEVGVARVARVDGDCGVAHKRLRAGGGDFDELAGVLYDLVTHGVEDALLRSGDDLFVGDGGEAGGAPVDHAFATVDVAAFVEFNKSLLHSAGVIRVHSEAFALPIAGAAEFFKLLDDDAAAVASPRPDEFKEVFAGDVVLGEGNAGFVG